MKVAGRKEGKKFFRERPPLFLSFYFLISMQMFMFSSLQNFPHCIPPSPEKLLELRLKLSPVAILGIKRMAEPHCQVR